jgi:methylated-DNA-[protein]-cysteine S-methyltransferase
MNSAYLIPSPLGDIALSACDDMLTGVFFVGQKYYPTLFVVSDGRAVPRVIHQAKEQLAEFFSGDRRVFDVPFYLHGTAFQRSVWQALSAIPYGEVVSYGGIAKNIGLSSGYSRAVGSANSKNPVSIIVPCHRVIGQSGNLTGYAGGVDRKEALLALENSAGVSGSFDFGDVGSRA